MEKYISEFDSLFAQLEQIDASVSINNEIKGPLFMNSIGRGIVFDSMLSALRTKDVSDLSWQAVTTDILEEARRIELSKNTETSSAVHESKKESKIAKAAKSSGTGSQEECSFCGKSRHDAEHCYVNPDSDVCKLPKKAIEAIKAKGALIIPRIAS